MTNRLSNDVLQQLSPLLGSLARLIAAGSPLGDGELEMLLLGVDLADEPGVPAEVQRWGRMLRALQARPTPELRRATTEALLLRGLPEAPVLLAVAVVSAAPPP